MEPFKKVFYTNSPEETIELGRQIGSRLKGGEIIAYKGGLGAGKTTITRGIALGMGLPDNVSSPTFSIVNEYHGSGLSLYHFDMYRISGFDDLYSTGFFDYLDAGGVLVIEWSENVIEFLPKDMIKVDIKRLGDNEREITVKRGEEK